MANVCGNEALGELEALRREVERLKREKEDLEVQLLTAVTHGDVVEDELDSLNTDLRSEILEHRKARVDLERQLNLLVERNKDLELILQTVTEHSDHNDEEWSRRYAQVEQLSRVDSLTGIANRRAFDRDIEREWKRGLRRHEPLSLVMCDVDWFKQYNDTYGHQRGDICLAVIAQLLDHSCRRPGDLAARYGGEEFMLILPETDLKGALAVAEILRADLANVAMPHASSPIGIVTLSIGLHSVVPSTAKGSRALLEEVDRQLYAAKDSGRNRICYHGQ